MTPVSGLEPPFDGVLACKSSASVVSGLKLCGGLVTLLGDTRISVSVPTLLLTSEFESKHER